LLQHFNEIELQMVVAEKPMIGRQLRSNRKNISTVLSNPPIKENLRWL
jgi:hypothetical protein